MPPRAQATPKKEVKEVPRDSIKSSPIMATPRKQKVTPSADSNDSDVSPSEAGYEVATPKRAPSMHLKAIKAREKALRDKVAAVTSAVDTHLEKDDGIVVDCFHHSSDKNAPLDKNTYDYVHLMKLSAPVPFILVKQAKIEEGPYRGHVAILLKQSTPFPMMELPLDIRTRILKYLVRQPGDELTMTLTQSSKKTAYCPDYKSKNKLAILATSKQLRDEAAPLVYGHTFHFPGTQVITHFLLQIGQFRKFLISMHSETYNAVSARTMFHLLPDARDLERLSFSHITSNEKPKTAVNNLFGDARPWFTMVGGGNPLKALKILKFDAAAFHRREKDDEGNVTVVQWDHGEQMQFWHGLKAKLEGLPRTGTSSTASPRSPASA